ncbi:MAG: hypothetical protein MK488_10490 [SAR324 cluster bacterium]|nr:hypothetical protein [SAR324 cluster bacterium]
MAQNKNTKKTIIILSSLALVIIIGVATGVITFDLPEDSKNLNRAQKKSDQCFQKLKQKVSNEKLMAITSKKKWNQSWCDFL